jgi:hypothetical protein
VAKVIISTEPQSRLLGACWRLKRRGLSISEELLREKVYPRFVHPELVGLPVPASVEFPPFIPPKWQPYAEEKSKYLENARRLFDVYIGCMVEDAHVALKEKGQIPPGPPKRRKREIPIDLKYEWAAIRLCFDTPFKQIAELTSVPPKGVEPSEDTVQKAVEAVFKELGFRS